MLVFVYGSLKRGHYNHGMMDGARYACDAVVWGYEMRDLGSFPGLVPIRHHDVVHGEVYEVDDAHAARLDRFEGCPNFYQRASAIACVKMPVTGGWTLTGFAHRVELYVLAQPEQYDAEPVVDGGVWVKGTVEDERCAG